MFPQIFGKYVLERELASGGMARVFLATLRGAGGFEKRLVVKQIRPELASDQSFIRRFVAEAKTTVELSHANIVPVYELGAEQGTYYIAMELCAGVSLAELLEAGAATPSEGAYIGVEICRALDYAHRKAGVVHRDVTPRNVMIDPEGSVRLIDFGIAASSAVEQTGGSCFGSPGHMPPEQLSSGKLTPAADVFAVAVLLIEAWTGRAPFRRETFEASKRAFGEPRPRLADTDASLERLEPLIDAALSPAPAERPQTAEELARPLREFLRPEDLGDIARRLGQRVSQCLARQARPGAAQHQSATPASLPATFGDTRSPGPSAHATLTFAARDALLEWTARIESTPPPQVSRGLGGAAELESGMTAPREPEPSAGEARSARRRRVLLGAALSFVVLIPLGIGVQELGTSPVAANAASPAPQTAVLTAPASDAPEHPAASSGVSDASRAGASPPAPPLRVHPAPPAPTGTAPKLVSPGASQRAPVNEPAANAHLQLTSEPGAWVEVDAVRVGRTPLRQLGVSPGRHAITFVDQLLGERLSASITIAARGSARVHADFTSANPQVYVR
jgi:tRNA A-37 threonylcarbamoyl transferase component Bud32